jgi:hypothetical protein
MCIGGTLLCADLSAGIKEMVNIKRVSIGMSMQEVKHALGESVLVGYDYKEANGQYQAITVANPVRKETIAIKNLRYEVYYYFTHIVEFDDIITDDELTPLVFSGNNLVGKGWRYLQQIRQQVATN